MREPEDWQYVEPTTPIEGNFTYKAPPGMEGEVNSLAVRRDAEHFRVSSAWRLTDEQIDRLASGAVIELTVDTMPPPPVLMVVRGPACERCGREAEWDKQARGYYCAHSEPDREPGMGEAHQPPPPYPGEDAGPAAPGDPEADGAAET